MIIPNFGQRKISVLIRPPFFSDFILYEISIFPEVNFSLKGFNSESPESTKTAMSVLTRRSEDDCELCF
jgi:hypothetical protein